MTGFVTLLLLLFQFDHIALQVIHFGQFSFDLLHPLLHLNGVGEISNIALQGIKGDWIAAGQHLPCAIKQLCYLRRVISLNSRVLLIIG